jgi:hypothetical protein
LKTACERKPMRWRPAADHSAWRGRSPRRER